MRRNDSSKRRRATLPLTDQRGLALITALLILITMTVIGIASITVTSMEGRMAGVMRTGEAASVAAESCLDTGVEVIMQTLDISAGGQLPAAFDSPAGPVPAANHNALQAELLGQDDNNADTPSSNPPNLSMTFNNFSVAGDIDRLFIQPKPGTTLAFDEPQGGSVEILYRVDCVASNAATGATTRIVGVYACTVNSDGCQRAL